MMDRYVKYSELERYLVSMLKSGKRELRARAKTPITCAEDAKDLSDAFTRNQAERQAIIEICRWAKEHAISGDLTLPIPDLGLHK